MANVIKHKRGSGSDPSASDLILGELAIRTDTGKLFTKMDSGAIAEIAGGGSDIAINTLSSSSGTGGGSATFNGSAYRFTLSAPPNVSAAQLLVSINGVIQKPVAGTGQPSEGFSVDGTDIILGDAPATGSDFFILTFKSLGVSEPADNTVTSAKIVDGAIVNADINASAAIAGTKISPNFGTQDLLLNGKISLDNSSELGVFEANTSLGFTNSAKLSFDFSSNLARIRSSGNGSFSARPLTFNIVNTEAMRIDTSGRLLIGTTTEGQASADDLTINSSGSTGITIRSGSSNDGNLFFSDATSGNGEYAGYVQYEHANNTLRFGTVSAERMRINSAGLVGIGTTSPTAPFHVYNATNNTIARLESGDATARLMLKDNSGEAFVEAIGDNLIFSNTSSVTERLRIDSSGKVGIGTNSPDQTLHVHKGSAGSISSATNSVLTLENSTDAILQFLSPSSNVNQIRFGDPSDNGAGYIDYNHSTNVLSFGTAGPEKMRLDSSGRLMIGTSTQGDGLADNLTIADSGNCGLTIRGGSSSLSSIFFADGTGANGYVGQQVYNHADNSLKWIVNGSESLRVNSSGNVGIGNTSPAAHLHLDGGTGGAQQLRVHNHSSIGTFSGNYGSEFRHATSATTHAMLIHAHEANDARRTLDISDFNGIFTTFVNGKVGIGTTSPEEKVHVANTGGGASILIETNNSSGGNILFGDDASNTRGRVQYVHSDDSMRLNTAGSERLRIKSDGTVQLRNSPGIDFSQIQSNNSNMSSETLDSYEEGTFAFDESNISVSNINARYTKIGRVVMLSALLNFGSSSNTNTLNLTGLPFTPDSNAGNSTCGGVIPEQNVGLGALFMAVEHGNNTVRIRKDNGQVVNPSNMSGKQIRFVLHYVAA